MDSSHCASHFEPIEVSCVCDKENKDETSNDLFGPGRTVGKFFDFGGRHIDVFISKTAERLGYGPRVTALRIRRRHDIIVHASRHSEDSFCWICYRNDSAKRDSVKFPLSPASITKKRKKIEKDIKCLLKYVKSKVSLTQKQAMDHILDLSFDYCDVRALLKAKGATRIIEDSVQIYSKFRFGDFDDLLLSSSRKALVSLRDAEINTLLQEWINTRHYMFKEEITHHLWDKIEPYLSDSETAFLVMRTLRRTGYGWSRVSSGVLSRVVSSIRNAACHFEWEECEAVFEDIFMSSRRIPTTAFEYVLQFATRMPRLLKSPTFRRLSTAIDPEIIAARGLNTMGSQEAIRIRRSIARGNKYSLCLDALKSMHSYPPSRPLLSVLSCPLQRILDSFIGGDSSFFEHTPTSAELAVYNEIARCIDSADHSLRGKAWRYADCFLALDIYRCDMMLQALSATAFATTVDFTDFMKTKRKQCVPGSDVYGLQTIYRHYDRKDDQIHLSSSVYSCLCDSMEEEKLKYSSDWMLTMRVERGTAFSSAGLYPLVAGYGRDEKCAYVAEVYLHGFSCSKCNTHSKIRDFTVTDGMKPEDLRIEISCPHRRALKIPKYFDVFVLRYAPHAYPKRMDTDKEGLDSTGPFPWRPAREHVVFDDSCYVRVITAEEAMASEEMLDEGGHPMEDEADAGPDLARDESGDEDRKAYSDPESDRVEYPSYKAGNESASGSGTRELNTLSCDSFGQLDTDTESIDVDQEIQDEEGYPMTDEESTESSLVLDEPTVEGSEVDPDLDPDEAESLSYESGDGSRSDVETRELDSLSCDGMGQLGPNAESFDVDLPICDEGMETVLVPESYGLAACKIGGQTIVSGACKAEDISRFTTASFHQAILVVFSVALGFILTRVYDNMQTL